MQPDLDIIHRETVRPEWIDYNGHMNVAYYTLTFDHATDAFFDHIGLDEAYRKGAQASTFALEAHITYEREMMAGAGMRFTTQLLGFDAKRIHYMHFLHHAQENYLASANELITIAVDMKSRRSTAMPDIVLARLEKIWDAHRHLPKPAQQGRIIGIKAKK